MFEICLFGSSFFIFFDQLKWLPFILHFFEFYLIFPQPLLGVSVADLIEEIT